MSCTFWRTNFVNLLYRSTCYYCCFLCCCLLMFWTIASEIYQASLIKTKFKFKSISCGSKIPHDKVCPLLATSKGKPSLSTFQVWESSVLIHGSILADDGIFIIHVWHTNCKEWDIHSKIYGAWGAHKFEYTIILGIDLWSNLAHPPSIFTSKF